LEEGCTGLAAHISASKPFPKSKVGAVSNATGDIPRFKGFFLGGLGTKAMSILRLIVLAPILACLFPVSRSFAQDAVSQPSDGIVELPKPAHKPDFNRDIYYKNKLEFSFESGWHPINIPWVYDFLVGDGYNMTPLKYTLVPVIASLRWHVNDIGGPWILRGNFDFTFSGAVTLIPRGPETHYFVFIYGIRRNFVHRNWRIVPFFDQRGGAGIINAKEPLGVQFGQGQNLTFTYNMGAGARYNFNPRYSISAGMNYMHISNAYLSEPKFVNYGINVYGPMFGIDARLGKAHHDASQ
jgi:Lipid A 3-O-deacylase (PagL)